MDKWEYDIFGIREKDKPLLKLQKLLNKYGEDGHELVAVYENQMIFKKRKH